MHLSCNHSVLYSTGSLAKTSPFNVHSVIQDCSLTSTPFVNRFREVVELAVYNASFIQSIREKGVKNIDDWRSFFFCFAAQMYGAGKTRLGQEFVNQIPVILKQEDLIDKYIPEHLVMDKHDLLSIIETFSHAETKRFDLTTYSTFLDFTGDFPNPSNNIPTYLLSDYIIAECEKSSSPIFFHFDEVGNFSATDLRQLRNSCWRALYLLRDEHLKTSFPFFYFSGRGAAYRELGSHGSPVQSHWLILEPLEVSHLNEVLSKSTKQGANAFKFQEKLSGPELKRLLRYVIDWTSGAPRQILYTCHMLEMMSAEFGELYKSTEGLKKVFSMLVEYINSTPKIAGELGPISLRGGVDLDKGEKRAYNYMTYSSWQKKVVKANFKLPWTTEVNSSVYLRSLNVFAKTKHSNTIQLVVPYFVTALMRCKAMRLQFQHLFQFKYAESSPLFEYALPEAALVHQYLQRYDPNPEWFPKLIPDSRIQCKFQHQLDFWENRGPVVNHNGLLTKEDIREMCNNRGKLNESHNLEKSLMGYFCDNLKDGEMVLMGSNSSSCDVITKVKEKFIIEFQMKSGKQMLSASKIHKELSKSVVHMCPDAGYKSLFVLLCASGTTSGKTVPPSCNPNIEVYVPTVEQMESFFGPGLLHKFQE